MPPVQNNQPGTGSGSRGKSVGLGPSVTPLGWLSAPRMNARGAIWAHIQIPGRQPHSESFDCGVTTDIGYALEYAEEELKICLQLLSPKQDIT